MGIGLHLILIGDGRDVPLLARRSGFTAVPNAANNTSNSPFGLAHRRGRFRVCHAMHRGLVSGGRYEVLDKLRLIGETALCASSEPREGAVCAARGRGRGDLNRLADRSDGQRD